MKGFLSNYCHYCQVENILQTHFVSVSDAQLYHVLHLETTLPYCSRYSFIISKQSNLFCCTHWYQDASFNLTAATLSSAASTVMLRPCTGRMNSFNLLKISVRYASCCHQGRSQKLLANGVSVSDKKKLQFHPQQKHCNQNLTTRQQTNFSIKNQSFIHSLPLSLQSSLNSLEFKGRSLIKLTICTALSNADISEFSIILTTKAYLCKPQWLLVYIMDTVLMLYCGLHYYRTHIMVKSCFLW